MVGYELVSVDENVAIYRFFPENDKKSFGVIRFDVKSGEWTVDKQADDNSAKYPAHLAKRLKKFAAEGLFKQSGYVAWW